MGCKLSFLHMHVRTYAHSLRLPGSRLSARFYRAMLPSVKLKVFV